METFEDIFEYVKLVRFLPDFTDIKPNGGIRHRFTGKGTNTIDSKTSLTEKDKDGLADGLQTFVNQVQQVIDNHKKPKE